MDLTPIELDEIDQYWNAATHDGDDKLSKQGLWYLEEKVTSEIQLDEFFNLAVNRYDIKLPLQGQIGWIVKQHGGLSLPVGPALALLASDSVSTSHLYHLSAGIRALAAMLTSNPDQQLALASDPCVVVRCALVGSNLLNIPSNKFDSIMDLLLNDPYQMVRDLITEIWEVDTEPTTEIWKHFPELFAKNLEGEDCPCNDDSTGNFQERFQALTQGFALPFLDDEILERVRDIGPVFWATQPFPTSMDDYLMHDIVEYLKGPIPDQLSISHAGHGINSYSLNYRFAQGPLAFLAQVAWGGVYGDSLEDSAEWEYVIEELDSITEMIPFPYQDGYEQRDFLLLLSRFRGICNLSNESGPNRDAAPILLKRTGDQWDEVPDLKTWDDVRTFLRNQWFESID